MFFSFCLSGQISTPPHISPYHTPHTYTVCIFCLSANTFLPFHTSWNIFLHEMDLHFDTFCFHESLPSRRYRASFIYALTGLLPNPGSVFLASTSDRQQMRKLSRIWGITRTVSTLSRPCCPLGTRRSTISDPGLQRPFHPLNPNTLLHLPCHVLSTSRPCHTPPGENSAQDTWSRLNRFLLSPMTDNTMTQHIFSVFICCQLCIMLKNSTLPTHAPREETGGRNCAVSLPRVWIVCVPAAGREKQPFYIFHCLLYVCLFYNYVLPLHRRNSYSNWILWLYALPCHYKLDSLSVTGQRSCCWKQNNNANQNKNHTSFFWNPLFLVFMNK